MPPLLRLRVGLPCWIVVFNASWTWCLPENQHNYQHNWQMTNFGTSFFVNPATSRSWLRLRKPARRWMVGLKNHVALMWKALGTSVHLISMPVLTRHWYTLMKLVVSSLSHPWIFTHNYQWFLVKWVMPSSSKKVMKTCLILKVVLGRLSILAGLNSANALPFHTEKIQDLGSVLWQAAQLVSNTRWEHYYQPGRLHDCSRAMLIKWGEEDMLDVASSPKKTFDVGMRKLNQLSICMVSTLRWEWLHNWFQAHFEITIASCLADVINAWMSPCGRPIGDVAVLSGRLHNWFQHSVESAITSRLTGCKKRKNSRHWFCCRGGGTIGFTLRWDHYDQLYRRLHDIDYTCSSKKVRKTCLMLLCCPIRGVKVERVQHPGMRSGDHLSTCTHW